MQDLEIELYRSSLFSKILVFFILPQFCYHACTLQS